MTCMHCIHYTVCGSASPRGKASNCKQFIHKDSVIAVEKFDELRDRAGRYEMLYREAMSCVREMENELAPLRLMKQTLEMASGKKFDF